MDKDFKYKEVETGLSVERTLDVAATIANLIPLIGGPVASILSGISGAKKNSAFLKSSRVFQMIFAILSLRLRTIT
jgi:hypothetical protein